MGHAGWQADAGRFIHTQQELLRGAPVRQGD
jgi:hypothetical protein